MKISRFDEVEFEVLDIVSNGFGYYPEGDNADRAERLMEEGILVPSPRVEWQKSGWKFTEDGVEYCKEFMDKVRQVHGHVWVTRNEEYEESDTAGDAPHRFGLS